MEQIPDYGTLLSKETARLTRLVENLLSVSRVTDAKPLYTMAPVHIGEVLDEALSRLQSHVQEKSVNVRRQNADELPEITCDREAMTQVFENIIDNAIKYSARSTEIEINARPRNGDVHISVKDSGQGISPKDVPLVFNKFFRGRNAGMNGSGLGLSIARKVVEDHGGYITIDSAVGCGTIVIVRLPRAQRVKA